MKTRNNVLNDMGVIKCLFIVTILFLLSAEYTAAQKIMRIDGTKLRADALDSYLPKLMQKANVQGMGIVIFNHNRIVYKKTFGYSRADKKIPLKQTTNIYGASLSKAVFAVLVMKLVEQGKLDLDKPLQEYLPHPIYDYLRLTRWHDDYSSLKGDTLYAKITARMCLDHTSGFPNWRWDLPDQKLKVLRKPGERYSYSGEGMVYLQVVIEKMTGRSLDQLMSDFIFGPLEMKNSAYTFKKEYEKDYSYGHRADGKLYEKDKDNEARAPSTLETTVDDLALFLQGVMQKKVINAASTAQMFSPQINIRSVRQMGPLALKDTTANDHLRLSYGLGWGLLESPYGPGCFKEGHGDGFQHYMILFPEKETGVLIMTNSDNGESIFKELLELSIADKYTPWKWQNYIPYSGL